MFSSWGIAIIASCEIASGYVRCDIERGVSLISALIRWQCRSFVGIAVRPIGGRELSSQPASQLNITSHTQPPSQPVKHYTHTHSQRPSHITRPWRGLLIPLHYKFTPFRPRPLLRVASCSLFLPLFESSSSFVLLEFISDGSVRECVETVCMIRSSSSRMCRGLEFICFTRVRFGMGG